MYKTAVHVMGSIRWWAVAALGALISLIAAAPAGAQTQQAGYESVGVPGGSSDPSDPTLPFTGLDLATAGLVGLAMLLIGLGLWQLGARGSRKAS